MDIILTGADGTALASCGDYELECAIGDDENDFDLSVASAPSGFEPGSTWYIDGTEWGGIVDGIATEATRGGTALVYSGRTLSGVLAARVVVPDEGSARYRSDGEANACIRALVGKLGLGDFISTPVPDSGISISYEWERFDDAWHGLVKCLASSGAKPVIRWSQGGAVLGASRSEKHGDEIDSDLIDFEIERNHRPVNHLVCAGTGEGEDRTVVHFFADGHGEVSHTQSLFGVDEVDAFYDYTNADEGKLEEEGRKKLLGYQVEGEVRVTVRDPSVSFDFGDTVVGRENRFGITVSAQVVRKTASGCGGELAVEYEMGAATATDSSGHPEQGGSGGSGGHAYYAGRGLSLTGYTFDADVAAEDIERIDADIAGVRKVASDAGAGAAEANDKIAAADIRIGKVETVESSDGAAASLSGEGLSLVLDLSIPRGPRGEKGEKGEKGDRGPQGPSPAGSFLDAHPPGTYLLVDAAEVSDPAVEWGGLWERAPSLGAGMWLRKG